MMGTSPIAHTDWRVYSTFEQSTDAPTAKNSSSNVRGKTVVELDSSISLRPCRDLGHVPNVLRWRSRQELPRLQTTWTGLPSGSPTHAARSAPRAKSCGDLREEAPLASIHE